VSCGCEGFKAQELLGLVDEDAFEVLGVSRSRLVEERCASGREDAGEFFS